MRVLHNTDQCTINDVKSLKSWWELKRKCEWVSPKFWGGPVVVLLMTVSSSHSNHCPQQPKIQIPRYKFLAASIILSIVTVCSSPCIKLAIQGDKVWYFDHYSPSFFFVYFSSKHHANQQLSVANQMVWCLYSLADPGSQTRLLQKEQEESQIL